MAFNSSVNHYLDFGMEGEEAAEEEAEGHTLLLADSVE
jgi:hypothetical protein